MLQQVPLIISFFLPTIRLAPPSPRITTPVTPVPPGTGGTKVQVLQGNDVARRTGAEGLPPIGVRHEILSSSPTQQVERVTLTNNMLNRADLGNTVIISSPPGVQASTVEVSTGSAVIQGDQVVWSGFSLESGAQASITVTLQATTGGALVGSGSALIQTVTVEALDSVSGQNVVERATGVEAKPSPGGALLPPVLALTRSAASYRLRRRRVPARG